MMEEKRQMDMGDRILYYTLCRKKIKNVNLRIHRDGSIVVSAPLRVPIGEIERILRLRASWIAQVLSRQSVQRKEEKTYQLWGKSCQVEMVPWQEGMKEYCVLVNKDDSRENLLAFCQKDPNDLARRRELWLAFLREQAQQEIPPLYERWQQHFCQSYGTAKQRLVIKPMTSRWGSRSAKTGRIALNLYLVCMPKAYLEYTIVHELCHLIRMDHSPAFHRLVEQNLPGASMIRSQMRHQPISEPL